MENSFPLQSRGSEVQEEGEIHAGDRKVAQHLGDVLVVEGADDFCIHDKGVLDDEIGDESADEVTFKLDGKPLLLIGS